MTPAFRWLGAVLLLLWGSSWSSAAPLLTLEHAPGELGKQRQRDLLVATDETGRELFVFDPETNSVQRFSEQGEPWGDPIGLQPAGLSDLPRFSRFDVGAGQLILAGSQGITLFTLKGVQTKHLRIFQPGDAIAVDSGTVAVSLVNIPNPRKAGAFLARSSFGEHVPRVAFYDRDGEATEIGLLEGAAESSSSAAMGRSLRLAWAGDRLYAAELGSYHLSVLDRGLNLRQSIEDPELRFEEALDAEVDSADEEPDLRVGQDASKRSKPTPAARLSVTVTPVITDIAWGRKPGQLYLLLDRESFRGNFHIDVLDDVEGIVRRSALTAANEPDDHSLKQIAVGRDYVWLRAYPEGSPILRVGRHDLDRGEKRVADGR